MTGAWPKGRQPGKGLSPHLPLSRKRSEYGLREHSFKHQTQWVFGLTEFRGESSARSSQPFISGAKANSPSFSQNSPSLPQNSVSSLFQNSTLAAAFRPFPAFDVRSMCFIALLEQVFAYSSRFYGWLGCRALLRIYTAQHFCLYTEDLLVSSTLLHTTLRDSVQISICKKGPLERGPRKPVHEAFTFVYYKFLTKSANARQKSDNFRGGPFSGSTKMHLGTKLTPK